MIKEPASWPTWTRLHQPRGYSDEKSVSRHGPVLGEVLARSASGADHLHSRPTANTPSSVSAGKDRATGDLGGGIRRFARRFIRTFISSSIRSPHLLLRRLKRRWQRKEEPIVITPQNEPLTEGYIEIVDAESGNRVITDHRVLESHKQIAGPRPREQYLLKQRTWSEPVQTS